MKRRRPSQRDLRPLWRRYIRRPFRCDNVQQGRETPWSGAKSKRPEGNFQQFLEDVTPFFYRHRVTYVDVGAYMGEVFEQVLSSSLKVGEAHIVEPNAESLEAARERTAKLYSRSQRPIPLDCARSASRPLAYRAKRRR